MIAIIDYGLGNLASIKNMLKRIEVKDVIITSDPKEIDLADKIILPGVGSFDNGMKNLKNLNLIELLNKKALVDKVPFLGICLGMQLMTKGSEEGELPGLGWFDAETVKFSANSGQKLKIPHMGWNYINPIKESFQLPSQKRYRFYFVHSYFVKCNEPDNVLFTTKYGKDFHSGILKGNLIGMQFHPEKSLRFGMDIFKSFANLN